MSIKSALGDDGFAIWDTWSRQSPSYRERDARAVWRSISSEGGIGIGTLFAEAKANGWQGNAASLPAASAEARRQRKPAQTNERRRQAEQAATAAKRAEQMLRRRIPRPPRLSRGEGLP